MANSWSDRRGGSAIPHFDQRELALALRVVRGFDVRSEACDGNRVRGRSSASALALFLVFLLGLLHTAAVTRFPSYPVGAAASAAFGTGHEDVSMQFKKVAAVVSSALAVSAGSHAQDAVQWRVEDGGNGHWYQAKMQRGSWNTSRVACEQLAGHLVTITSVGENTFVVQLGSSNLWLGASATESTGCTLTAWQWVTGEPMNYLNWAGGEPGLCAETCMQFASWGGYSGGWNNYFCDWSQAPGYIIEWSADCNADGIVDYGQIRAGELADTNANNIPDCCEATAGCNPCPADIDESGAVNAVDLAAILSNWGTNGGKYPRADIDGNGDVDGADLAAVLSAWGPCP